MEERWERDPGGRQILAECSGMLRERWNKSEDPMKHLGLVTAQVNVASTASIPWNMPSSQPFSDGFLQDREDGGAALSSGAAISACAWWAHSPAGHLRQEAAWYPMVGGRASVFLLDLRRNRVIFSLLDQGRKHVCVVFYLKTLK
jgi:hypothetical protein